MLTAGTGEVGEGGIQARDAVAGGGGERDGGVDPQDPASIPSE